MKARKAVAIVVTYNPQMEALDTLLSRLVAETTHIVVVDNGSRNVDPQLITAHGCQWVPLGDNLGIGYAQNRGIAVARQLGAEAVVLFDQDSLPDSGMIGLLADDVATIEATGALVAAVGPAYRDDALGFASQAQIGATGPIEVDHIIASGSYIPMRALDLAGDMREDLFIDYVDIEWALRARTFGLRSYQSRSATMAHSFGEAGVVLGRRVSFRPPMRQYYLFRNSIWLWRQDWVPLGWKMQRVGRLILRMLFNIVLARPHCAQLHMIWRGIRDGFAGKMGRGHD